MSLVLNNVALPFIGDAAGLQPSAADGNLYLGLHTADPGASGNQTTNEISYTGYVRIPVVRDGTQWLVAAGVATTLVDLFFGLCTAGGGTATYAGIGTDLAGAGNLLYRAAVLTPIGGLIITPGITPKITAGAALVTEI